MSHVTPNILILSEKGETLFESWPVAGFTTRVTCHATAVGCLHPMLGSKVGGDRKE